MRWTDPATIHLTLRFLGEVAVERVAAVREAMAEAAARGRPLELVVTGAGGFPSPRRPRVLWLGLGGDVAALQALVADLEARLTLAGFDREAGSRPRHATSTSTPSTPFTPHLTLGRARSPRGAAALAPALAAPPGPPRPWRADALVLFESHLTPGGARHVALRRAPLGGAGG